MRFLEFTHPPYCAVEEIHGHEVKLIVENFTVCIKVDGKFRKTKETDACKRQAIAFKAYKMWKEFLKGAWTGTYFCTPARPELYVMYLKVGFKPTKNYNELAYRHRFKGRLEDQHKLKEPWWEPPRLREIDVGIDMPE